MFQAQTPRSISRLEAGEQHLDDLVVVDVAYRESRDDALEVKVPPTNP
jgi:hypothetical protein